MSDDPPIRVVIDTDPGLDDAIALLFALADPRFGVELVTSVAGNIGIETTTRNVGRLLAASGAGGIPYAAGADRPIARKGISEEAIHGPDGLGGIALPEPATDPLPEGAVDRLAALLTEAPEGSLTVLALGPLTNLARLAQGNPIAFARIAHIIAMGGTIQEPGNCGARAEFNLAADPEAARLVLSGCVPVTLVPLDVTRRLRATPEDLDILETSDAQAARYAAELMRAYFAASDARASRPLHDPCVMLLAVQPALFGIETMTLEVDCADEPGRLVPSHEGRPIGVAMRIDGPAALAHLWQRLAQA